MEAEGATRKTRGGAEYAEIIQREVERRRREEALQFWNQEEGRRHPKQVAAVFSSKRLIGVFGGNRTGKTCGGAVRALLFLMGQDAEPYIQDWGDADKEQWYGLFNRVGGIEAWCGTINWDVHRDITQPEILRWLPRAYLAKCRMVTRKRDILDYIRFPNGSRLTFKSYDSGREAWQGKALDYLWLDEEPPKEIWEEARQRVLDKRGYVAMTLTPLNGLTFVYDEIWLNSRGDPETEAYQFTWDDNPWLDEDAKARLLGQMSEDEIAARVYGEFLPVGTGVFSKSKLLERRRQSFPAESRWSFSPLHTPTCFVEDSEGDLHVWAAPVPGRFYILGVDPAEGLPNGDNSVVCVLDTTTADQVAEYACHLEPGDFAKVVDALGRWYGNALIVVERNNNGHAVLLALDQIHLYPCLYKHPDDDRLGWPENARTRPILIAHTQDMVRTCPETIHSKELLEECLTFVRNVRGRPEASGKGQKGGHKDDRIFAWGMALVARERFGPPLDPIIPSRMEVAAAAGWVHPSIREDRDRDRTHTDWDATSWVPYKPS